MKGFEGFLDSVPLPDLVEHIKARNVDAAVDELPLVRHVAESDSLAPLLQLLVEQTVLPLI